MDTFVMPDIPAHILLPPDTELHRVMQGEQRFRSVEQCVTCDGKRRFLWWNQTRSEHVEWTCNCEDQFVLHRYFWSRGIGLDSAQFMWRDLDQITPTVYDAIATYADRVSEYAQHGIGLAMRGANGTGKSSLGHLLLRRMMKEGIDGYFVLSSMFFDKLADGWKDAEYREWFDRRVRHAQVLVLDDLGKETFSEARVGRVVDETLRYRMNNLLPTIISTNMDNTALAGKYGTAIIEVIEERSLDVQFLGPSYRLGQKVLNRKLAEMDAGLRRPLSFGMWKGVPL